MIDKFLNILFPESCPVCRSPATDHRIAPICAACWQTIQPYTGPRCQKCSRPLVSDLSLLCEECMSDEPAFHSVSVFGLYTGALRKSINLLKYYSVKRLEHPLSDVLLHIRLPEVDGVLPVPLYRRRLRQRGFNQSALLAKHAAGNLGVPLVTDCLMKTRDTVQQVGLNAGERKKNIRNAFVVQNSGRIYGKNILLVDDVITTGATVRECSKVLKKAGAHNVYVLALAHGVRD